jgi:hypothetical protein
MKFGDFRLLSDDVATRNTLAGHEGGKGTMCAGRRPGFHLENHQINQEIG